MVVRSNHKRSSLVAAKPVVHYDSMFSDLPRFPRQSWVQVQVDPTQDLVLKDRRPKNGARRAPTKVHAKTQGVEKYSICGLPCKDLGI